MIDGLSILINCIEGFSYAYLTAKYIELPKRNLLKYYFIFTLIVAAEITISNYFIMYDGIYSILYFMSYALLMNHFDSGEIKNTKENNLIFAINLSGLVSVGNELVFLIGYLFFHLSPLQMIEKYVWIVFFTRTVIIIFVEEVVIRYSKDLKKMHSGHDYLFVSLFIVLELIIVMNEGLLLEDQANILVTILTNMFVFCMGFGLYYIFFHAVYEHFVSRQKSYFEAQMDAVRTNVKIYQEKDKEIRTMKHDLINQMIVMSGYLQNNQIDDCERLISNNINNLNQMPVLIDSGNTAIDAILSAKFYTAKEENIKTKSYIQIDKLAVEEEYDIALILGNLLDNAMENIAENNKEITAKIMTKNGILIRVENTTDRKEVGFSTSKNDKYNHGLGLNSVRIIAGKYNGDLYFDISEGIFAAIVYLKI